MKYKLLALSIISATLVGCGSDNSVASSYSLMAYDPAVKGMKGAFECEDGTTGTLGATGYDGVSKVTDLSVVNSPDTCAFEFLPTEGAQDVSNGKDMSKANYKFPKGLAKLGKTATASPITTLIEKQLDGATYTPAAASEVLEALGFGELINEGLIPDITDFLLRTEEVIAEIAEQSPKAASQVLATNAVLSDVLVVSQSGDDSADALADATKAIAVKVIAEYEEYPKAADGKTIYLELAKDKTFIEGVIEDPTEEVTIPDDAEQEAEPVEPPGGTGGTGGGDTGGGSSTGG